MASKKNTHKRTPHAASRILLDSLHAFSRDRLPERTVEMYLPDGAAAERADELARANDVLIGSVEAVAKSGDIGKLIEHFLAQAIRLMGAIGGAFTLFEDGRFKDYACFIRNGKVTPESDWRDEPFVRETSEFLDKNPAGFFGRLLTEKITRDRVDDIWGCWPAAAEFHSRMGHTETWNVACISRGTIIASLGLFFEETPAPDAVDEAMLLALAQQAALALELNRLSDEARQQAVFLEREKAEHRRLAELVKTTEALKRTLDVAASEPNLNLVLGHVLSAISVQLESQSSALWLADPVSGRFTIHSVFQEGRVVSSKEDLRTLNGAWGSGRDLYWKDHIRTRKPFVYQVEEMRDSNSAAHLFFSSRGIHTLLGVPLLLGSEIVGSLTIRFLTPRVLSPEQLELTQALAHQATMAIQLTSLAARAGESALIEERMRFSRDVHDTLAQGFAGILMQLGAARQVEEASIRAIEPQLKAIEALARSSLAEARRAVRSLRLPPSAEEALERTVEQMVNRARAQSDAEIRLEVNGRPHHSGSRVNGELALIVQESVHNAMKHAAPKMIVVSLEFQGEHALRVSVKDDGAGFDTSAVGSDRFGLIGMQERADSIGASLTVVSERNRGTQIVLQYGRNGN